MVAALSLLLPGAVAFSGSGADLPPSLDLAGAASRVAPDAPAADTPAPAPPSAAPPQAASAASEGEREALLELARQDPEALGPLSLGSPDAGLLLNPIPMPAGHLWSIREPPESYGTAETIDFIETAIEAVEARYPGSPRLLIGDISRPDGGRLDRHRSHQAGRDVDLGFYYLRGEAGDFRVARKGDLDLARTWALVRALVTETDVDRIFLDRSLQRLLYAQAVEEGEDRAWLDDIFGRSGDPEHKGIIQHERRHKNHMHVRFFNPVAQERARVVYATLVEDGTVPPPVLKHRVRRGETLSHLAIRYGTSARAIRAANHLRGSRLRAGRPYLIPIRRVPVDNGPLVIPPRRLPPEAAHAVDSDPPSVAPSQPAATGSR